MGFDSQGQQRGQQPPWGQQPQWQPEQWQPPGQQPQQGWGPPPQQQPRYAPPPQPQAPPAQAAAPKQRKRRPLLGCLGFIVIAAVIAIIIAIATSGSGPSPWKATVGDTTVINPADLAVTVHVTNTGKTAATPTCTIKASDPSGAYTGFDEGTLTNSVPPGQTDTYVDNMTITSHGAQYITTVTVSC